MYGGETREDKLCRLLKQYRSERTWLYQYLDHKGLLEDAIEWMHATGQPVRFQ